MTLPEPPAGPADALSLLLVGGPDASAFLHGQLTCDVAGLPPDHWTWAGYCSAKGRLLALGRVARIPSGFAWQMPASETAPVAALLRKFVLRSKVTLDPAPASDCALRLSAPGLIDSLAAEAGDRWEPARAASFEGALVFVTSPDEIVLHGTPETVHRAAGRLAGGRTAITVRPAVPDDDVEHGIPWLAPATRDAFIPQMADLDRLGGISFQKGCYPGQEIVARTQYLGRVKRRLHLGRAPGPAAPGDEVMTVSDGQTAGHVLRSRAEGAVVLAVLDEALAASTPLRLGTGDELTDVHPCRDD